MDHQSSHKPSKLKKAKTWISNSFRSMRSALCCFGEKKVKEEEETYIPSERVDDDIAYLGNSPIVDRIVQEEDIYVSCEPIDDEPIYDIVTEEEPCALVPHGVTEPEEEYIVVSNLTYTMTDRVVQFFEDRIGLVSSFELSSAGPTDFFFYFQFDRTAKMTFHNPADARRAFFELGNSIQILGQPLEIQLFFDDRRVEREQVTLSPSFWQTNQVHDAPRRRLPTSDIDDLVFMQESQLEG